MSANQLNIRLDAKTMPFPPPDAGVHLVAERIAAPFPPEPWMAEEETSPILSERRPAQRTPSRRGEPSF